MIETFKRQIKAASFLCAFFILGNLCLPSVSQAIYIKDNNVWVYSNLFVERFDLSPAYADEELQGAKGIAIRLVPLTRSRCHQTPQGEECMPSYQWIMDIFFDINEDIGIIGDAPRQFIPWRSSLYFLAQKNPYLPEHWKKQFGLKGGKLYLADEKGVRQPTSFEVFSYKRPVKIGLQMVQARIDSDVILADPDTKRILEFTTGSGTIHRVTIPRAYWQRVAKYQQERPEIKLKNIQGGVEKDPNIWIYSKEFAEKYHMPLSGVSTEMEGAMALSYRKDSRGTEKCGFFGDPNACARSYTILWGAYLPVDARLYYADESMDNFYKGYRSSNVPLHENQKQIGDEKTYPNIVAFEGLKGGAHLYRVYKRKFFDLLKTKEKSRWFGGGVTNFSYLQPKATGTDFMFAEYNDSMLQIGVDQYLIMNSSPGKISLRDLYDAGFHKARIPRDFMATAIKYVRDFESKNGSVVKLVEKHYATKHSGKKK